jgi:hypothetical protein
MALFPPRNLRYDVPYGERRLALFAGLIHVKVHSLCQIVLNNPPDEIHPFFVAKMLIGFIHRLQAGSEPDRIRIGI